MERIPHRELRNNSSEVLRRVAKGESFEITNHGDVVAILQPPTARAFPDVVKPATRAGSWHDVERVRGRRPSQEVLDQLREERR